MNRTLVLMESDVELYWVTERNVISGDSARSNVADARSAMKAPPGRLTSLRLKLPCAAMRLVARRLTDVLQSVRVPPKNPCGE